MGLQPPNWADAIRDKLDEVADRYPVFAGSPLSQRYTIAEVRYDGIFEHDGDAQHVITISADLFRSLSRLPETWQKEREPARAKAEARLRSALQCVVTSVRP